jgi:hypothetical protein
MAGYNAAPILPDHPKATTVLILGIVSFFTGGITGPFAWYMGGKARQEVKANPGVYKDGGTLTIGWVLGIIGTIQLILWAIYIIFVLVIVGIAMSQS